MYKYEINASLWVGDIPNQPLHVTLPYKFKTHVEFCNILRKYNGLIVQDDTLQELFIATDDNDNVGYSLQDNQPAIGYTNALDIKLMNADFVDNETAIPVVVDNANDEIAIPVRVVGGTIGGTVQTSDVLPVDAIKENGTTQQKINETTLLTLQDLQAQIDAGGGGAGLYRVSYSSDLIGSIAVAIEISDFNVTPKAGDLIATNASTDGLDRVPFFGRCTSVDKTVANFDVFTWLASLSKAYEIQNEIQNEINTQLKTRPALLNRVRMDAETVSDDQIIVYTDNFTTRPVVGNWYEFALHTTTKGLIAVGCCTGVDASICTFSPVIYYEQPQATSRVTTVNATNEGGTTQQDVNTANKQNIDNINTTLDNKVTKQNGTSSRYAYVNTDSNNNVVMKQYISATDNRSIEVTNTGITIQDSYGASITLDDNKNINLNAGNGAFYNGNEIATTDQIDNFIINGQNNGSVSLETTGTQNTLTLTTLNNFTINQGNAIKTQFKIANGFATVNGANLLTSDVLPPLYSITAVGVIPGKCGFEITRVCNFDRRGSFDSDRIVNLLQDLGYTSSTNYMVCCSGSGIPANDFLCLYSSGTTLYYKLQSGDSSWSSISKDNVTPRATQSYRLQ